MSCTDPGTQIFQTLFLTCAREIVVAILMEGASHDPVCQVEGFLYPVPMVDVYVKVEHTGVVSVERTALSLSISHHYRKLQITTVAVTYTTIIRHHCCQVDVIAYSLELYLQFF